MDEQAITRVQRQRTGNPRRGGSTMRIFGMTFFFFGITAAGFTLLVLTSANVPAYPFSELGGSVLRTLHIVDLTLLSSLAAASAGALMWMQGNLERHLVAIRLALLEPAILESRAPDG